MTMSVCQEAFIAADPKKDILFRIVSVLD